MWRRVPEVIDDGQTGFVVDSVEEAISALPAIGRLERAQCRRTFERRFTVERMASEYVSVYRALASPRVRPRLVSLAERRPHAATR